ncbi:MAG: hypothetical protein ACJ73W_01115, partial [Rubrobacteraceae bacterium]
MISATGIASNAPGIPASSPYQNDDEDHKPIELDGVAVDHRLPSRASFARPPEAFLARSAADSYLWRAQVAAGEPLLAPLSTSQRLR